MSDYKERKQHGREDESRSSWKDNGIYYLAKSDLDSVNIEITENNPQALYLPYRYPKLPHSCDSIVNDLGEYYHLPNIDRILQFCEIIVRKSR